MASPPASVLNVVEQARNFVAIDTLGDDEIYGTDAGGLLHYSNGNDVIHAGGGDDRISAAGGVSAGKKTIYGEAGNDQISINETNGTAPNGQTISATAWGLVFGGDGDDQIGGVGGNDEFHGDAGNDRLFGSGGNDLLDGGSGADFMAGGSGLDSFRGTIADFSGDTITDFARGDRLQITDANLASFSFSHSGDSLSFGGSTITLSGSANLNLAAYALAGGGVEIPSPSPPPTTAAMAFPISSGATPAARSPTGAAPGQVQRPDRLFSHHRHRLADRRHWRHHRRRQGRSAVAAFLGHAHFLDQRWQHLRQHRIFRCGRAGLADRRNG